MTSNDLEPIFAAMENRRVPTVEWLVCKGARLNYGTRDGLSVLNYAKKMGNKETIDPVESGLSRTQLLSDTQ